MPHGLLTLAVLLLASCGDDHDATDGPAHVADAGTTSRRLDAGSRRATQRDGGAARAQVDAATAAAPAPPAPPPAPEGPTGEGPVLRVRDLPPPAVTDAGFEPLQIPWSSLEALLVATDAVSLGTRQSFQTVMDRPWGERPIEPFAFRKEAEPLAQPGYWHPEPRVSILLVPYDPLGTSGPNVAFYALAEHGVRFLRAFPEHGLACAGGATLVEGLAIQSAGAEVRRLYGCNGLGEEATIDVVHLDGRRLAAAVVHGSFLVHRSD